MTDSNSGITPQQGAELGIAVLPMPIIVDGRTFYENVDIFPEEFYRLLDTVAPDEGAPRD